jgi:signal transduction histidine kinase
MRVSVLTFIFFACIRLPVHASPEIFYSNANARLEIGSAIEIMEDKGGTMSVAEVLSSNRFKPSSRRVPNLGLSSSAFWLKLSVKNLTAGNNLLLVLEQPNMDEVSFYTIRADGGFTEQKMGEYQNFSKREYNVPDYLFRLNLSPNERCTYLLKVKSAEQIQIPLILGSEISVFNLIGTKNILSGLYFGIMLVMLLYNLFIYFSIKDKSYLYYVVYIIIISLTQTSLQGFPFQFLWPNLPWMAIHGGFLFPSLVGIAGLAFLHIYLHSREFVPRLFKITYVFYFLYAISMLLAVLNVYAASYGMMEITAMLVSMYMLYVAIVIYKKGYRPAKYFLIAWSFFLAGVCIYILKDFDILPYNNLTRYSMQAGSAFEVILISFGLADRINILKKEKEESQAEALVVLGENERIVREQNVILETKVMERTNELWETNKELSITFNHLKETQTQLVHSEKMASLGLLTAGIAHEINNPINFVKSNIKSLKRTVDEFKLLLGKYGEIVPGKAPDEKLSEIRKLIDEMDLNYSMQEIDELLLGIDDGVTRTTEIIKGLRSFSRHGEDGMKLSDLHEGLDSTLILLNGQIKGKIIVRKEYGNIPWIQCYPGKLNQVFMNILNNAVQAIVETGNETTGLIVVRTWMDENAVYLSIGDNGKGITQDIKDKIFDPFFTTKSVGQGIGLGLSIAYKIIGMHHGQITVESEPGKGSLFTIALPKPEAGNVFTKANADKIIEN